MFRQTTAPSPRILILRGGALGDFILTLPAIRVLRRQWPSATIELIGHSRMAELAVVVGLIDRARSLDVAGMAEWFVPCRSWPERERDDIASFDLILSYLGDADGVVQANLRAAGAKRMLACSPIVASGHAADHFLRPVIELGASCFPWEASGSRCLSAGIGLRRRSRRIAPFLQRLKSQFIDLAISTPLSADPLLPWPEPLRAQGRNLFKELGLSGDVISLHPGSGSSHKNWPVEQFALLADRVRRSMSVRPLFILGEADGAAARALPQLAPGVPVLAQRTLKEVASVLAVSRGYVGNDSGITHLAAALGIPVVALFGPTEAAMWGPRGPNVVILRGREPTSAALAAIAPGTVLQALKHSFPGKDAHGADCL